MRCVGFFQRIILSALFLSQPLLGAAPLLDKPEIPFEKFQLSNGLTVVVHEDRKAPVVAVAVWYHVGSKDEKPGKTGFAHLYEHLMFQGSEHYRGEFFQPFEQAGATNQNGTTWLDRTNFYQTVPTTALDMALWMESDRMGHLLPAIDQKLLDEQRGVVQNEKREGDNQPYGKVMEMLQAASFPEGHPYHWETIGSMEDLNAASLEDVKQWFQDYYGAANATLVLVGDIDLNTAKEKAQKYFGHIPSGPPLSHRNRWIAERTESSRAEMNDRVAQARIYKTWNVPPATAKEADLLDIAAGILGGGKTSRFYQRLVYRDQIADTASANIMGFELASLFMLQADVKKNVDSAKVEAALNEELTHFLEKGPTKEELQRIKIASRAHFIKGLEHVSGKAEILASGQVYQNDPGAYRETLKNIEQATPESVRTVAKRWLAQGDYTLTVKPFPKYSTQSSTVDRTQGVPVVDNFPSLDFPTLQHGKLKNGIKVVLAERHNAPLVAISLQFDAGYAADQGQKLGTSSFAMGMLREGTQKLSPIEIARRQEELGATIFTGSDLDTSNATLSVLKSQLKPALELLSEIVREPAFETKEMQRYQKQWLARIEQEKTAPTLLALRLLPPLVFGEGHAYAMPLTGSGTAASIASLTPQDLRAFHSQWIRPDNVRILVAGDTDLKEILLLLDATFGEWQSNTDFYTLRKKNIVEVAVPAKPRIFLLDQPNAVQSVIIAGRVAPSTLTPTRRALNIAADAFGGIFTSRLNMNLREDKHWSYGAGTDANEALGQRLLTLYASVQTDKTSESIKEIINETNLYVSEKPITSEEIHKIKNNLIRALPGKFETTSSMLGALGFISLFNKPDDYVQTIKPEIENLKEETIRVMAQSLFKPESFTWLIVGDLKKIEPAVRALNIGEVKVLDSEGKVEQ